VGSDRPKWQAEATSMVAEVAARDYVLKIHGCIAC
jgi:hypothetical protein